MALALRVSQLHLKCSPHARAALCDKQGVSWASCGKKARGAKSGGCTKLSLDLQNPFMACECLSAKPLMS